MHQLRRIRLQLEEVAEISRPPRHILRLARYLLTQRDRLATSYNYIAHSPEHVSSVLREAISESQRIADAEGRTGMLQELTAAFLEASERARREDAWGRAYAADAENDDDSFAEASALEAGSRWHSAA